LEQKKLPGIHNFICNAMCLKDGVPHVRLLETAPVSFLLLNLGLSVLVFDCLTVDSLDYDPLFVRLVITFASAGRKKVRYASKLNCIMFP
jgi:hypothetical protein